MTDDDGFDRDRQPYVSSRVRRPNAQQRRDFIELLGQGIPRAHAARLVGSSATRMKFEERRDPQFGRWVEEATHKGLEERPETIRGAIFEIALGHVVADREPHPKAWEALKSLADTWLPENEYKRTRQVEHGQKAPFEFIIGQRVPEEVLLAMPPEERRLLLEAVRMLEAGQQRLRLIEGGGDEGS